MGMAQVWFSFSVAGIFALLAGRQLFVLGGAQSGLAEQLDGNPSRGRDRMAAIGGHIDRSRIGRRIRRKLLAAGMEIGPASFLGRCAMGLLVVLATMSLVGSTVLALVITGLAGFVIKVWLDRRADRRREQFIGQLPDLARLLSNAANAGLAIKTGIEMAAREIAEPARTELGYVTNAVAVGYPLEDALEEMSRRLPSREVSMLVTTLIVQGRAGGRIITALRNIATTLDARKEVRREVRTLMAGAVGSTFVVTAMGLGSVVLLNLVNPEVVDEMLGSNVGRAVILVSGTLYAIGFVIIRRLTRIEI